MNSRIIGNRWKTVKEITIQTHTWGSSQGSVGRCPTSLQGLSLSPLQVCGRKVDVSTIFRTDPKDFLDKNKLVGTFSVFQCCLLQESHIQPQTWWCITGWVEWLRGGGRICFHQVGRGQQQETSSGAVLPNRETLTGWRNEGTSWDSRRPNDKSCNQEGTISRSSTD